MPSASIARSSGSSAMEMRRICQAKTAAIRATSAPRRMKGPKARLVADRNHIERAKEEDPAEHDGHATAQYGAPSRGRIEVGEPEGLDGTRSFRFRQLRAPEPSGSLRSPSSIAMRR